MVLLGDYSEFLTCPMNNPDNSGFADHHRSADTGHHVVEEVKTNIDSDGFKYFLSKGVME